MDTKLFFDRIRSRFPGRRLTVAQVAGIERLLAAWEAHGTGDRRHLAYILVTSKWETGNRMVPVRETFATSDAQAIARLDKAWAEKKLTWVKRPYWRDGFFGRGDVQLTHAGNYDNMGRLIGVDLLADPGRALDPVVSARILIEGCTRGVSVQGDFTAHALEDFINDDKCDWRHARKVVNPGDRPSFEPIAADAEAFDAALAAAGMRLFSVKQLRPAPKPQARPQPSALPQEAPQGAPAPAAELALWLERQAPQRPAVSQPPARPPGIAEQPQENGMKGIVGDLVLKAAMAAAHRALEKTREGAPPEEAIAAAISRATQSAQVGRAAASVGAQIDCMPAENKKPWWQSIGMLGGFAGLIASGSGFVGLTLTTGDVSEGIAQVTTIATAVGALVALWGRARAKRPIS